MLRSRLSRRLVIFTAAGAAFTPVFGPMRAGAVQGNAGPVAGLDPGNTGMLPGPVPDGMPELVETFFPDLSFRRPFKSHAGLFAVGPAVYAQALGEGTPVVEAQIRSGETRIMIEGKESVPGITANHLVTYKAGTDTSLGIIEGRELTGAGLWGVTGDAVSRAVIVDDTMVVAGEARLVARSAANGDGVWAVDVDPWTVRFLAADERVVVGLDDQPGGLLRAWSLADGSLLWEMSVDDGPDRFASEPVVHDGWVLISTPGNLLIIDPLSGEIDRRIEYGEVLSRLVEVRVTGETVLVGDTAQVRAFDFVSGEQRWSYRPLEGLYSGMRTAGSLVFVLVWAIDIEGTSLVLEVIDAETGEPRFELPSRRDGEDTFSIADYIVADGAIVLAGDAGLRVYRGSGEPYAGITSPVSDNAFASETFGFRYTWDDGWEATGTSFLTNEGITLYHRDSGAAAAQYVTRRELAMDEELDGLVVSYPVLFGPDTRYLRRMEQLDAPDISAHVPMPHEVMLGRFVTSFSPPFDVTLCLTVAVPLGGDDKLVFEFMTAEWQFDQDLPLFWTFFENLEFD